MLTLQPAKAAIPEAAVTGFLVHARAEPAGEPVMLKVTGLELVVTVRPELSWTATAGWVSKTAPPLASEGDVVNASFAAGPATVKGALTALVNGTEVAVSV